MFLSNASMSDLCERIIEHVRGRGVGIGDGDVEREDEGEGEEGREKSEGSNCALNLNK